MAAVRIKAAEKPAATSVKVKVVGNFRVLHEGVAYTGGDTLEIPDDEEHRIWLQSGWGRTGAGETGPGRKERRKLMPYLSGQVSVGTTATALFTQSVPDNDSVLISSSAAAFVGPAGVTTTTGFPVAANTPVLIPTTGAEVLQLFGVVTSGTATISYLSIA